MAVTHLRPARRSVATIAAQRRGKVAGRLVLGMTAGARFRGTAVIKPHLCPDFRRGMT